MFHKIKELHLAQDYGHFSLGSVIDSIVTKYPLFPNEALYVIDCKHAQVEPLSDNFSEIIGIDCLHKNELSILYEHINKENMDAVLQWVTVAVQSGFDESLAFELEKDIFQCLYQTHHKRTLLKCTTGYARDSKGAVRYCIGKLIDLTGLVSFQHFTCSFFGPNRNKIYQRYHETVGKRENPLSKRETEVLCLIGKGYSSTEISKRLFISRLTVDKHRRNIIEKIGSKTTWEAYKNAINSGWLLLESQ